MTPHDLQRPGWCHEPARPLDGVAVADGEALPVEVITGVCTLMPCVIPSDLPWIRPQDREFAAAFRSKPKWVVSRSLKSVGANATLIADDFEKVIRNLKAELKGEILIGGPVLAQSLTEAGLIDEYRLYLRPVVLGGGKPFFVGPRPPLHFVSSEQIAEDMIQLTCRPA